MTRMHYLHYLRGLHRLYISDPPISDPQIHHVIANPPIHHVIATSHDPSTSPNFLNFQILPLPHSP